VVELQRKNGHLYAIKVRLDGYRQETISVTRTDVARMAGYKEALVKQGFPLTLAYAMTGG
jgi:hypothetical protein